MFDLKGRALKLGFVAVLFATTAQAGPLPQPASDEDYHAFPPEMIELGRDLFFDPVLSGNKNIACATCHHPSLGTSDAMSLSIGEGGRGLGAKRKADAGNLPPERIPRNAPALFNLGAKEFTVMFHDGRTAKDRHAMFGIRMPEGRTLEHPVVSPLAAQNILPILSPAEMAGHPGENDIADAVADERIMGPDGAWDLLARRVQGITEYRERFKALGTSDIHITDIGTALSAFIGSEFRADQSPFDRYLAGDTTAMSEQELAGMDLFYGKARCSTCHTGTFQTDHSFHAIGLPQFGPGKMDYADTGHGMVSGEADDMYRFRTPTLRNVTQSAPYGHNGAYSNLEDIVRHHLNAVQGLAQYDRNAALLPSDIDGADDWKAMDDFDEVMRIAEAIEISIIEMEEAEIAKIMSFLGSLTDEGVTQRGLGVPASVPSGLEMDLVLPPS